MFLASCVNKTNLESALRLQQVACSKQSQHAKECAIAPHHHVLTVIDVMSALPVDERPSTSTQIRTLLKEQNLTSPLGRLNSRRDACPAPSDHKNLHFVAN